MRKRTLSLKREALADLTTSDLTVVAGGQQQLLTHVTCGTCTWVIPAIPTDYCFSLAQCRTLPVNDCITRLTT